jgi:MYXO-CTERM domain-containing protein
VCTGGQCVTEQPDAGPDADSETDVQEDAAADASTDVKTPCNTCTTTTKCACRSAGAQNAPEPFFAGFFVLLTLALLRRRMKFSKRN